MVGVSLSKGNLGTRAVVAATIALLAGLAAAPGAGAAPLPAGTTVERSSETHEVSLIGAAAGSLPRPGGLAAQAGPRRTALAYADELAPEFGAAGGAEELTVASVAPSVAGGRAVRLQQQIAGLPVIGGQLVVDLDRTGELRSIAGEAAPDAPPATTPRTAPHEAAATAVAAVAKEHGVDPAGLGASEPVLSILDSRLLGGPGLERPHLVWQLEVGDSTGVQTIRDFVAVDAMAGFTAVQFPLVHHALERVVCDAGNTNSQVPCTPADYERTEGEAPTGNADVDLAYEYAGDTYDLFASLGRDSLDGNGMPLVSTTDYCDPDYPCPYKNAFWNGQQMVYGDGFASADDVVGHELAHGVTDFSSSLFYYYQSGAINESMSDVFGELVDLTNGSGNDDPSVRWELAEDLSVGPIRNMEDPTAFDHPDRTGSPLYVFDPDTDFSEGDAGGVHSNSGVNNKAAYLMTDGGSFNGQTISGLGIDKVSRIYYLVNNSLLVSGSDYQDLGAALRQACATLAGVGAGGITSADCVQVDRAVRATEMDVPPVNKPATNVGACDEPGVRVVPAFRQSFENAAAVNADFGIRAYTGKAEWYYPGSASPYLDATYATSGTGNVWGLDQELASNTAVQMRRQITVPKQGWLRFNHSYGFEAAGGKAWDGGLLEYSTDGGTTWQDAGALIADNGYSGTVDPSAESPLAGQRAWVGESGGYLTTRANLAPLVGEKVLFQLRMVTDTSGSDYGWFVDDFEIYACKNPNPPQTRITKAKRKLRTGGKRARAKVAFTGSDDVDAGAALEFECKVDKRRFKPCSSPLRAKLKAKRGKGKRHKILVRAVDSSGNADPSPAKARMRAIRRGGGKR